MNTENKKLIRTLTARKLKSNRARNIVAVIAIALTCTLFTTLFAIGASIFKSVQEATMRQVGTAAHGGLKYLTQAQYSHIKESPLIKDISYSIIIGVAENEALRKNQTEIRYGEDKSARWGFSYPETGDMPRAGLEAACSTITLDLLGVKHELGQKVPLEFTLYGQKHRVEFTLAGFWEGDGVMAAQQVWLSEEYLNSVVKMPEKVDFTNGMDDIAGTISADVWFSDSFNIDGKINNVLAERGYAPGEISTGVNWAYMTSGGELDPMMTLTALLVIVMILASGYLIIYSVFSISVTGDIKFYGLLKTIGATGKQLRRIVRAQALLLSAAGLPIGFALGFALGYVLTPVIAEITEFKGASSVSVNPLIFVFSGLFSLITVFISCRKPGRIAAKVSPVEAVASFDAKPAGRREKRTHKVTALNMAYANITRKKGRLALVAASLALSVILLGSVYSVVRGFDMELYLENQMSTDFLLSHYSVLSVFVQGDDYQGVDEDVRAEIKKLNGLTGYADIYLHEEPAHKLSQIGHKNLNAILDSGMGDYIAQQWGSRPGVAQDLEKAKTEGIVPLHVYGAGDLAVSEVSPDVNFDILKSGNYVIATHFFYENASDAEVKSVYNAGDKLTLTNPEGEEREFEVIAVAGGYPYSMGPQHSHLLMGSDIIMADNIFQTFYSNTNPMTTVFNVADEDISAAESRLKNYTENINPDLDYRSRAYYMKEFESLKRTYMMTGGAMSFILAMVGVLNFINAVFTSINSRRTELAMLQSVGMTGRQLKTMLFGEGALYALITVISSATLGVPLSYLIIRAISGQLWFFKWNFSFMPTFVALPVLLLICAAIPLLCYRFTQKASLAERLRAQ
ncbi:MAG: FtsX-like permease family protein [Clostridiales bacterium]|nr:FtsX-like permease family protein [Clostridiales bacterium]